MYSVAQTAHGRNATQVHVLPARVLAQGAPQQPRAATHRRCTSHLLLLQQELHKEGASCKPRAVCTYKTLHIEGDYDYSATV